MKLLSDICAGRARERAWLVGNKAWMEQWCIEQAYQYAGSPLELKSGFAARCRRLACLHGGVLTRKALRNLAQKAGFDPNQPRVPRGNPDGGQWTGEGATDSRVLSDATPDPIVPWAQYAAADGHHYVPRGVFEKEKYSFRPETLQAFEDVKTGPLNDRTSNWYDEPHRNYNKAVEEALDRFLARNNIRADEMTPDQARSFAEEIKTSRDPRIRRFNTRLWMREIMYWLRRGPRGRE